MRFCIIRLGKDSVDDITAIDSREGIQNPVVEIFVKCKQVPSEVTSGTFCFIWLGSDNNKGSPTAWAQGLRAFGKIRDKKGGPNYNDNWIVHLELGFVLKKSIQKHEVLAVDSTAYYWCSNIPIIGLNTNSNQTVQVIKPEEPRQDIAALFYCLNAVDPALYEFIDFRYPELDRLLVYNPPILDNNTGEPTLDYVEEEINDISTPLMQKPFDPSLINIDNRLINIDLIIKRLKQDPPEIDLYPEFQRKDDLWDATKQSRLIESILIRFPLPAFYFDGSNKNKWLVVDGLQRLSSIRNFALDKTLKLTNLEFLSQLNGYGFNELDRDLQRLIEETQIVAYIINPGTPDDVKFNIFKRINTGGLILESQEIRHALYQGAPAKFIQELADSDEFKKATSYSIRTQRMLDRDFANRFLAFYLLGFQNYSPDLDSFMSKAMARIYDLSDAEKNSIKDAFMQSMAFNSELFGVNSFRKIDLYTSRKKPINKALFDVFSVLFALANSDTKERILENRENFIRAFIRLLTQDNAFQAAISTSTSDKNRVLYRFEKISELIKNVTQDD
ncbi:MAG TPA: DUF262 domain-containing protein [Mucilaginibacter sp.]|nr:DUF262 domain-containing protein [Mucilaginibacter sp.]